jgi:hypothetical protein
MNSSPYLERVTGIEPAWPAWKGWRRNNCDCSTNLIRTPLCLVLLRTKSFGDSVGTSSTERNNEVERRGPQVGGNEQELWAESFPLLT